MEPFNLAVTDVKPFVPAQDFGLSRNFYTAIGWKENWVSEGLAEFELGGARILLQKFYVEEWAKNFMLYVNVADAQAWYNHINPILEGGNYGTARITAPKVEDYGAKVTYVFDPSGVLLHYAEAITNLTV